MAEATGQPDQQGQRERRAAWRRRRQQRALTYEEILRRNYVERIKAEKHPYELANELERLARTSYEEVPEEDMLRLQWLGLYHDKPKVGYMMMRIKVPGGILTPQQLEVVARLSEQYGRSQAELTTRQDIQLHWIRLEVLPEVMARLQAVGLSTRGACGDVLRNITSCPVAGLDPDEVFDVTEVVREAARRFSGSEQYGNLPRKHKWTITACPAHCSAPEIHDVALVGTIQDGQEGFAVWVGGGLSTAPRIARSLGVFVPAQEALEVNAAILDVWSKDLRYRSSRATARFKFMVDDYGPEKIRELIEQHLGRKLADIKEEPRPKPDVDHLGVHQQKQAGRYWIGYPIPMGRVTADQLLAVAQVADSAGAHIRLTREQNLIVSDVPEQQLESVKQQLADRANLRLDLPKVYAASIACTGEPYCNYSVGETKPKLDSILKRLIDRFGDKLGTLRVTLDGCPHACAHHWVGDIGIQATTLRTPEGKKSAYDIILRGGLGQHAAIGKAVVRRVPDEEVEGALVRLLEHYFEHRKEGESIQQYFQRLPDEQIDKVARGEAPQ